MCATGWLAGCAAPIRAERISTRQAYAQVEAGALRTGKPSADTVAILHRYDLDRLAATQPDQAVRQLHNKVLASGERDLLFALAEMSYVAGEKLRRSVKPWDPRDARDYYLGSAVYSWLFLFGDGQEPKPGAFDRRFRRACDLYNYSLGLALTQRRSTNGVVLLASTRRRLPVGEAPLSLKLVNFPSALREFEWILLTDQFRVEGLSVRNREPGLGAPLICVRPPNPPFGLRSCSPATVLLRGPGSLADLQCRTNALALELYSAYEETIVAVGDQQVPLETDLTTFRAYGLSQSRAWGIGPLNFLTPAERFPSQLLLNQPYDPDRIPLVFVHGTFSSPVTWAEMGNSLLADPVLRKHYQLWSFVYGSGNPLLQSIAELRGALTAQVHQFDPGQTNPALHQMVLIGHSQGGLLAKGTAIHAGDRLWRVVNTNRLEDLNLTAAQAAEARELLFLEPLPFVKRVIFIATPHRGSYLAGGFVRGLARRIVSLPRDLVTRGKEMLKYTKGSPAEEFFGGELPTSLDSMSPQNPALLAMAEIRVEPGIKAHSIIPVTGQGDYRQGRDGVVSYQSAHVEYVASELVVRSKHSCLNQPATIEEVRRLLHEHLEELK